MHPLLHAIPCSARVGLCSWQYWVQASIRRARPPLLPLTAHASPHRPQDLGVPKDILDRNIKKASDAKQADFSELVYEAYGPGGTG